MSQPSDPIGDSETLRDPVCGMKVKEDSAHRASFDDEIVVFCSAGCRDRFLEDPATQRNDQAGLLGDRDESGR